MFASVGYGVVATPWEAVQRAGWVAVKSLKEIACHFGDISANDG